jgi:hypothetical protein
MEHFSRIRGIVITVLMFVVVCFFVFNEQIYKCKILIPLQLFFSPLNIPKDFYIPVLDFSLEPNKYHYEVEFRNKYVGEKDLVITTPYDEKLYGEMVGGKGYIPNMEVCLKIMASNKILWQATSANHLKPMDSGTEIGFIFADYQCPRDLPIDEDLMLVLDVVKHDPEFENKYKLRLKIRNYIRE